MSFAATWMDPVIVTLSEIRQRQISCDMVYMCKLKRKKKKEVIYTTEIESQMQKTKLALPG